MANWYASYEITELEADIIQAIRGAEQGQKIAGLETQQRGKEIASEASEDVRKITEQVNKDLAAEKKARYLLPPDATADQIRAKTAEIIRNEMTGSTYSPQANLQRAIASYRAQYGEGSKAFNHAAFDVKVAPELRAAGKNPRSSIKFKDGKYKTKNKSPGVYIDVENGKVIEFDGNIAKELPEYSAMLR